MGDFKYWADHRKILQQDAKEANELFELGGVQFTDIEMRDILVKLLNKAKGYDEVLVQYVKDLLPQNATDYHKEHVIEELENFFTNCQGLDRTLAQKIKELLPQDEKKYQKSELESKLTELLADSQKSDGDDVDNITVVWENDKKRINNEYMGAKEQISTLCDHVEKYIDDKDGALSVLEDALKTIIEKSDLYEDKAKKEVQQILFKQKRRFNWRIAIKLLLLVFCLVSEILLFNWVVNSEMEWLGRGMVLAAMTGLCISLIMSLLWLNKTIKKRIVVISKLENLLSSMQYSKVSKDEIKKVMDVVSMELKN